MAESVAVTPGNEAPAPNKARKPAVIYDPDLKFIRELRSSGGETLKRCYQCATCSITCELSPADNPFPRKEMLWATWGLKDRLLADPDVFLCYQCNDCTTTCPRGARPGDVLAAVRARVYRTFAVPSFMGAALSSPNALLGLFIVPILVLLVMLFIQQSAGEGLFHNFSHLFGADMVRYHHFLKHGILEGLFLFGNSFIFLLAAIGFSRYYKNLKQNSSLQPKMGFIPAAIATVKEIMLHKRFNQCGQNKPRTTLHLLVIFGFFGAAATAGLALIYMIIWMGQNPGVEFPGITLSNPIKWLGVSSGLAMVIGSVAMILRRLQNTDDVGADGYADKLFLWMILLVAATGLLTWLLRLAAVPAIAYPIYFIHLVLVFFLLWYMPFSKFAHMIYRGLALVWAHQTGRVTPRSMQ